MIPKQMRGRIEDLRRRYPEPRSALIPSLFALQADRGYLDVDDLAEVAAIFHLTRAEVFAVASYYDMLRLSQTSEHRIEVCDNVSCMLLDSRDLVGHACRRLGVGPGVPTADGALTIGTVECLGSCASGPVAMVDGVYREGLDVEKLDAIIDSMKGGKP